MKARIITLVMGLSLWELTGCAPAPVSPPPAAPTNTVDEDPYLKTPTEPDTPFQLEEGFTPLSLVDFTAFATGPETWTVANDVMSCTGRPRGYLSSKESYGNFIWKLEYRFLRRKTLKDETRFNGNTGFLVYVTGEDKLWPSCLEVQGKHVQMGAIKENGDAEPVTVHDDEPARKAARKSVGEWNRLEIVSRDGALSVKLNDADVSRSEPGALKEGKLGIQAEDHPYEVRRMRIRTE